MAQGQSSKNFLLDSIVGLHIRFDKWQIRKCTDDSSTDTKNSQEKK